MKCSTNFEHRNQLYWFDISARAAIILGTKASVMEYDIGLAVSKFK